MEVPFRRVDIRSQNGVLLGGLSEEKKMVRLGTKLAVILALFISIISMSHLVVAGCCIGTSGCFVAFDNSECPFGVDIFTEEECTEDDRCDVGIPEDLQAGGIHNAKTL